jgi:hypothetical protein
MGELVPGCTVEYCVDDTLRLHFGPEVDCLKVTVPVKERYRAHFYHAFRVYFSRFPPPYYNRDNWEHLCYYLRDTCSVFLLSVARIFHTRRAVDWCEPRKRRRLAKECWVHLLPLELIRYLVTFL